MIIGDPFKFAIGFNLIKEWNEDSTPWINGIYDIYIYGVKYPDKLYVTEFNTNLKYLFYNLIKDMKFVDRQVVNHFLKNINDDEYTLFLLENKFLFSLESSDMNDHGLKIFYMADKMYDYIIVQNGSNIELFNFYFGDVINVFQEFSKLDFNGSIIPDNSDVAISKRVD
ncbi:Imm42 family immunity protein [Seminibacterium arietis]|uniref:Imm42 family immunity protein n=1 Tax=Seminibacterium arietis TaxID=1173502 RepID=A0ABW3I890_9PAST